MDNSEKSFRQGATHAANWYFEVTKAAAKAGKSAQEICVHLTDLEGVMADWRSGEVDQPDGNPWEWSEDDLTDYIEVRRKQW